MQLQNKVAIVTGGGGGMGRAIALEFARQGARVAIADIAGEAARQTAGLIRTDGGQALALEIDVTRKQDVESMAAQVMQAFGTIDILVNNAGVRCIKPLLEHTEDDWHRMINVNLTGHFLCAQAVIPQMLSRKTGRIINLASIAAHTGRPDRVAYCAAKAGVLGLTRAMAMDLRGTGICVTVISPGSIETPLNAQAAGDPDVDWGGETIVGRWGTGQDVANTATFLASDGSAYITGSEIVVDGGWLVGRARDGELGMHAGSNT